MSILSFHSFKMFCGFCLQEQYIFVYDGLMEALMTGETSTPCPHFKEEYDKLQEVDAETGKSKLQSQYEVGK